MRLIAILFSLAILLLASCDGHEPKTNDLEVRDDILTSFIDDQWTYEGTRLMVFVHAITGNVKEVFFELINAPDFIHLEQKGEHLTLFIDAPMGSHGEYAIDLSIKQGDKLTNKRFYLKIREQPSKVYHLSQKDVNSQLLNVLDDIKSQASDEETLLLVEEGNLEELNIDELDHITIQAASKAKVLINGIKISEAEKIKIRGMMVYAPEDELSKACIEIDEKSKQVFIENCLIQTNEDAENWSFDQWKSKAKSGMFNYASHVFINNNLISQTFHGIENNGPHCQFNYNIVDRFAGDAVRNTADDSRFEYNTLKNAIISDYSAPDGNHDDLFQAWTFDEPVKNVRLSHNIAIDFADENLKLAADTVQGLACFDGFIVDWTIENNLVLMDHPHGIALFGAKDCKVLNNTIARNPFKRHVFESEPWIMIHNHKNGSPSSGSILKNNLTTAMRITDSTALQVDNVVMDTMYQQFFTNYNSWNFQFNASLLDSSKMTIPGVDFNHK